MNTESREIAKGINDYLNHYISVADAKASGIAAMTALTIGASSFFFGENAAFLLHWTVKISIFLHLITILFCGMVIYPRKPSRGDSVIFWEDVAITDDVSDYQRSFQRACSDNFMTLEYSAQNYYISCVLSRKHKWLRRSMVMYGVSLASVISMLYWPVLTNLSK